MCRRPISWLAALAVAATFSVALVPLPTLAPAPAPAQASIVGTLGGAGCDVLGTLGEGILGKICQAAGRTLGVLNKAKSVLANPLVSRAASLAAIVAWVVGGAKWTISHVAAAISQTTSPALSAAWFGTVFLRIEGIAWLLALPFLAAAAIQAVLAGEASVILRSLAYLPLAALMTGLAVPVTMLLLAVTDSLSAGLAHVAGQNSTHFLTGTSALIAAGLTLADPFVTVIAGMLLVVCGLALWTEMIVRELAVYVVVLMLPLVFCAMVWPARRVWATKAVELLVALILAKFAIIVPLALGAAALSHGGAGSGAGRLIAGLALVGIGCLAPWVLMRLIPMTEVSSAAVGHIRSQMHAHAGVPTPEAAVAHKVGERIRAGSNGSAGLGDVPELLRGMRSRGEHSDPPPAADAEPPIATTAPQPSGRRPSATDLPVERTGAPSGASLVAPGQRPEEQGAARPSREPPAASEPPSSQPRVQSGKEPPTMVQQPDGSWQQLEFGDPTGAPPPPPPWEQSSAPAAPEDDPRTTTPPADPLALAPQPADAPEARNEDGDAG